MTTSSKKERRAEEERTAQARSIVNAAKRAAKQDRSEPSTPNKGEKTA